MRFFFSTYSFFLTDEIIFFCELNSEIGANYLLFKSACVSACSVVSNMNLRPCYVYQCYSFIYSTCEYLDFLNNARLFLLVLLCSSVLNRRLLLVLISDLIDGRFWSIKVKWIWVSSYVILVYFQKFNKNRLKSVLKAFESFEWRGSRKMIHSHAWLTLNNEDHFSLITTTML